MHQPQNLIAVFPHDQQILCLLQTVLLGHHSGSAMVCLCEVFVSFGAHGKMGLRLQLPRVWTLHLVREIHCFQ
ncbi:hypothetical protein HanRHA438_Chr08g0368641 [Helianthus annuus]|nr:hypothetical protein HanIR_Chr08g0384821 [Helianthus annuus]KAJ0899442.1 hypothetical protein HanRHA438_Chr08g0368641 [Helianthus annuus]